MKSIAVILNLLHYFYHGIQYDKTRNFVHGTAFEVQYDIYIPIFIGVELKRYTESIKNV